MTGVTVSHWPGCIARRASLRRTRSVRTSLATREIDGPAGA